MICRAAGIPYRYYLDQAELPPGSSWRNDADATDWDFTVTTDVLLNGSANFAAACCGALSLLARKKPGQFSGVTKL